MPTISFAQTENSGSEQTESATPPFSGTIFVGPDIISPSDPTTFIGLTFTGEAPRFVFDRRTSSWQTINMYLFPATFDDNLTAEIRVNPEFCSSGAAMIEAQKYGALIGKLPTALRADMESVTIHKGDNPFGGGNKNLLIHSDRGETHLNDQTIEETLIHELSHTSLDGALSRSAGWLAAQEANNEFISTYARDFPDREDIAESFLLYMAVRHRSDRISASLKQTIKQTIPNRIAYFTLNRSTCTLLP
jgi:hypothetical protein